MPTTPSRSVRWLPWLLGAAALAAVVIVALHAAEEREFVELLERARPAWLLCAFALQAATYLAQASVWRVALRVDGAAVRYRLLARLSIAKLFVDQALPSLGLSGTAVVARVLEQSGVQRPIVMSAVALDAASYYLGYVAALTAALALTIAGGQATELIVTVIVFFVAVFAGLAATVLAMSGRATRGPAARLHRIPGVGRLVDLLRQADSRLVRNPVLLARAASLQVAIILLDAATLWTALLAVGARASAESVFVSFVTASLVRMFGLLPGGLGTFEAASVATLALSGVPVAAALSATLLFRGLSFWLPMLPGLALARGIGTRTRVDSGARRASGAPD